MKEDKDEFAKELLYLGALVLYRKRKLSLGKAAELAGYNKLDFIGKLQAEGEHIFDYTDDEIEEIFEDAKK